VRRDSLNTLREFKDEGLIPEDNFYRGQDDLQDLTNRYTDQIDEIGKEKEAEIMEV
jgi:ribosome recycling factor